MPIDVQYERMRPKQIVAAREAGSALEFARAAAAAGMSTGEIYTGLAERGVSVHDLQLGPSKYGGASRRGSATEQAISNIVNDLRMREARQNILTKAEAGDESGIVLVEEKQKRRPSRGDTRIEVLTDSELGRAILRIRARREREATSPPPLPKKPPKAPAGFRVGAPGVSAS